MEMSRLGNIHIELGWGAPSFKDQFPQLPADVAEHFDKDNKALIRLRVRGYLTDSARDAAIKKIGKAAERELVATETETKK